MAPPPLATASGIRALLSRYVAVESAFVGKSNDQAIGELVKANPEALDVVYATALSHEALGARTALCNTLLRQLAEFPERFGVEPLVAPLPPGCFHRSLISVSTAPPCSAVRIIDTETFWPELPRMRA